MPLAAATRLGPYEIVAPLGAGGMGEVYRARDTRLGREVAIKVLPAHLIDNAEVRARFEREARTISSLNHPHICTLFDVGREGETDYLVMELVEGETLAQKLTRGAIPMAELLRLATQIADALDRAHRAGIVHRDFKPGNVMVTRSGAKLMDFGLARAGPAGMSPHSGSAGVTIAQLTQSPTIASPLTQQGSLIGTFLYMAPEQLEGKEADTRTDIWALGCVLYEMATGRRAFDGKSQATLITSIMGSEPPPIAASGIASSPALDALIRACLAKDPEERIQTAHDVKLQLTWISQSGAHSGVTGPIDLPKARRSREPIAWAIAGVALAAALFLTWRVTSTRGPEPRQVRFTIPLPAAIAATDLPRVSPDGTMLAFAGTDSANRSMIWLRPLNSLVANPVPGTEGTNRPFWSPDSRWLAFTAGGKLKKVPVSGGPPVVICDAPNGFDGTWSRNDDILFDGRSDLDPIWHVKASGGIATAAMPVDTLGGLGWPVFLADGRHYLFSTVPASGTPQIMLAELGKPQARPLGVSGSRVEYTPDGYLMFARDGTLLAQRFDERGHKIIGDPFPVAEDLPVAGNAQANFSLSHNGVLIYRATGTPHSRLVWLDRAGRELGQVGNPGDLRAPALSPDGRRVAVRRRDERAPGLDVWITDLVRGTTSRFSFGGTDGNPVWSPDGSKIMWSRDPADSAEIVVKSSAGIGAERVLSRPAAKNMAALLDWSRDGKLALLQTFDTKTNLDLYTLRVDEPGARPEVLLRTPFFEGRAQFSPDGRWIAYESDETGRMEVYVISFGGDAGKWQISTSGGNEPRWSRDGRELYYLVQSQRLMAVSIDPGPSFNAGTPHELFRVRVEGGRRRNVYDVAADGRFLFQVPVGETNTPFTAVLNWRTGAHAK